MERINLLPEDMIFTGPSRLVYLADKRFLPMLAVGSAAALGLMIFLSVTEGFLARHYAARTAAVEKEQVKVSQELQRMEAYVQQLNVRQDQLKQQIGWNEHRTKYLQAYRNKNTEWGEIFEGIKRLMPYGVWLTELDASPRGHVRMAGGAFEEELITRFMGELKENPTFGDVTFNFVKKDKIGKTQYVKFEVSCQLAAPVIGPAEESPNPSDKMTEEEDSNAEGGSA